MYIPEFGIATLRSLKMTRCSTKQVRMCGKIAHLMLMVLKQN